MLYAAETFEQFENLLRFSNSLDYADNLDRWEKLSWDLEELYGLPKQPTHEGKVEEDIEDESEQATIVMEADTPDEDNVYPLPEIEKDMQVILKPAECGKVSVQDYVEAIAAHHPLLGMVIMEDNYRKAVEKTASQVIKYSLNNRKVSNWAYLTVILTIIQYAKNWNKTENSGFWEYIAEQFGYKSSSQIYDAFTMAVKISCQSYNRLFVVDLNGNNNFYSTVLAHALSPSKSFYALFEFLMKFYSNNLDCFVYSGDSAIGSMISVLRGRFQGATTEQDEDIRGNIYGIQIGLKALITQRPGYMKSFLTRVLQRMGTLLKGSELLEKDYLDVLLNKWFISKIAETSAIISPTTIKPITPKIKGIQAHRRTTGIVFSYSRIRVEYVLDNKNEPALRIASFRLTGRDNPITFIRTEGKIVHQQTIDIYGNDYGFTSEEVIIPLTDICMADFTRLELVITIGGKQIFTSGSNLHIRALLFKNGKLQTGKTVDEGNYTLFAPKSVSIEFQGNVKRQRRSYFGQLLDVFIEDKASILTNGKLLCCSRPREGLLRFVLPQTKLEYVLHGRTYPIYSRAGFALTATGASGNEHVSAILQNGDQLNIQSTDANSFKFSLPAEDGGYSITLLNTDTGRILDEIRIYITDNYALRFDRSYYLDTHEDGRLTLDINKRHFELRPVDFADKAVIPFGNGEIHIQIPRIRLLLDGNPLPTGALWKGEFSPCSTLQVLCPESLPVSLYFGESQISRLNNLNFINFAIGHAVQAYNSNADKVSVWLDVEGDKLPIFDVVFKMSLREQPSFSLSGNTLLWLNGQSFMGDKTTTLKFVFTPETGNPITLFAKQHECVLSNDFPSKPEKYSYRIMAQYETALGTTETLLAGSNVIFGDRAAVIFRSKILRITKVTMDGNYIKIKPIYADEITYIGTKNLNYTDLSGDYAHFTAKLFFMTCYGRRYFTDLNPVDIYLVSETSSRLHISFDDGEGLFINGSGNYGAELYIHTDPPRERARYFFMPDYYEYEYCEEML